MVDFKIRRGLSSTLFVEPGVVDPRLVIEEGCWYLCTDSAELYLGTRDELNELVLKKINARDAANDPTLDPDVDDIIDTSKALFQKIDSESELPSDFESEDFDANITYFIPLRDEDGHETGRVSTYIFDRDGGYYVCTNSVDELAVRAMVLDAIDVVLEGTMAARLPELVQQTVKQTIEDVILHGGDATPDD
jgi:hypothetical protein